MSDDGRRHLVRAFFLLAMLGAAGVMFSSVVDAPARTMLQAACLIAAVVSGIAWAVLAASPSPGRRR